MRVLTPWQFKVLLDHMDNCCHVTAQTFHATVILCGLGFLRWRALQRERSHITTEGRMELAAHLAKEADRLSATQFV